MRFLLLVLTITFISCGSGSDSQTVIDSNNYRDSVTAAKWKDSVTSEMFGIPYDSADAQRKDIHGSCCFTNEKEFLRFLPDQCGAYRAIEFYPGLFSCLQDTTKLSSANRIYTNDAGQKIEVAITDYCAIPEELRASYELRMQVASEQAGQVTMIDSSQNYYGYCLFSSEYKSANVNLVVDNRIYVSVFESQATSSAAVLSFYKNLPLVELAKFSK